MTNSYASAVITIDIYAISAVRCGERDAKSFAFGLGLDKLLHHYRNVVCRLRSVRSIVQVRLKKIILKYIFQQKIVF